MNIRLIPLCFLALFVFLLSCQRDLGELPGNPDPQIPDTITPDSPQPPVVPPDNQILTSIIGMVTDENGDAMPGASAKAGNKSAITDEYGIFRLTDVLVAEHSTFVKVDMHGYFTGSRTIVSEKGSGGFVRIKMSRKKLYGSFQSTENASINISSVSSIQFSSNSVRSADGLPYTGKVNVYAKVIDPEAEDFNNIMPGDLRGLNRDSQAVALKSFGMLTVSLESENGQSLQIANDKSAVIRMKVPNTLLAKAPAEIPLWHFSETDGKWREEGIATLEYGWYTGSVNHFSTWNYDVPSAFVFVTLKVRIFKGGVRPYSRVKIINNENGTFSDQYTDSSGFIRTWVPKDAPLTVQVLTDCGEVIYSKDQDPLSVDTELGSIYPGFSTMIAVHGRVNDCDNQPVSGGYANMNFRGLNYTTEIVDGEFYFSLNKCESYNSTAEIYFTDASQQNRTHTQRLTITNQSVDLGVVSNCSAQLVEYLKYSLGSDSTHLETDPMPIEYEAFENGTKTTKLKYKWGIHDTGFHELILEIHDSTVHVTTMSEPYPILFYGATYTPVDLITVDVKKFGRVGEAIHLTFTGQYQNDETGVFCTLNGETVIRRRK